MNTPKGSALVIGFGSIGARHARVLTGLGFSVHVVSRRPGVYPRRYDSLASALAENTYDYAVVANETSHHQSALLELLRLGFAGPVLVEKPLAEEVFSLSPEQQKRIWVGYNLRCDSMLRALHRELAGKKIISAEVRAGSYLPGWRKGRDYRSTESAHKHLGGGVLRDMSHELDYVQWIFGQWRTVAAHGGHLSQLEIDSDDVWQILLETESCRAISLAINYLDRNEERRIVVNTPEATYCADLIAGTLTVSGEVSHYPSGGDDTYLELHRSVLSGNSHGICSFAEGLETVALIQAVERANKQKQWVKR